MCHHFLPATLIYYSVLVVQHMLGIIANSHLFGSKSMDTSECGTLFSKRNASIPSCYL